MNDKKKIEPKSAFQKEGMDTVMIRRHTDFIHQLKHLQMRLPLDFSELYHREKPCRSWR